MHRNNPHGATRADPGPLAVGIKAPFASIGRLRPPCTQRGGGFTPHRGGIQGAPRGNHPTATGGFRPHQNSISAPLKVIHKGVQATPEGGFKAHRIHPKGRSTGGFTPHQKYRFCASESYPHGGSNCTGFNGPKTPKSYPQGGFKAHRGGIQGALEGSSSCTVGGFKAHRGGTRKLLIYIDFLALKKNHRYCLEYWYLEYCFKAIREWIKKTSKTPGQPYNLSSIVVNQRLKPCTSNS